MICSSCRNANHPACETPDCCCGHAGSPVRPLTGEERHARALGLHSDIVRPANGSPASNRVERTAK